MSAGRAALLTMTTEGRRRSVVMRRYGAPDVLHLETGPIPSPGPTEVLIETIASAVNRSDLEIRAGHWPIRRDPPFPYVPGLEVLGTVVAAGERAGGVRQGERVITAMQGLGGVRAERDGGYSDYVLVDAGAVAAVPDDVDPYAAAALGLGAITADRGLARVGELDRRRLAVTGAAGGVGSSTVAIAAARGAEVVAVAHGRGRAEYLRSLGAREVVRDPAGLARGSLGGAFDLIGGPVFEPVVAALEDGGRYVLVGALLGDRVSFSLWELMRPVVLTGYSSETLDGPELRRAAASIFELLRDGRLAAPEFSTMALERAAEAHALIEAGGVKGRILLVPGRPA